MYLTQEMKKDFSLLFSEKEIERICLWDKISTEELMKILERSKATKVSVDYNSYGEFMFIDFVFCGRTYFVYGLGLHEYRKIVYKDRWIINSDGSHERNSVIPLADVKKAIAERLEVISQLKEPKADEDSHLFNELADMSDDDGALSMLY